MTPEQKGEWPTKGRELAIELHRIMTIDDQRWHRLKSNNARRAAELISGSLVQLISGGNQSDTEELLTQALLWLKGEVKEPGCPKR